MEPVTRQHLRDGEINIFNLLCVLEKLHSLFFFLPLLLAHENFHSILTQFTRINHESH